MSNSTETQPVRAKSRADKPQAGPTPAKPKRRRDTFFDLTDELKDAEVARFDRAIDEREFRPLTRKQRRLHEMAGVPVPKERVTVEVDAAIMMQAERLAKRRKMSLDHFVEESIRGMVAFTERH